MPKTREVEPFFQGRLDVWCAPYAVINAVRLLRDLRVIEARQMLHEAIMDVAQDQEAFQTILNQHTDYVPWVDSMLDWEEIAGRLAVDRPFDDEPVPPISLAGSIALTVDGAGEKGRPVTKVQPDDIWSLLQARLSPRLEPRPRRCAIFQFIRFLPIGKDNIIRHWTCARALEENRILFYDCSLEEGSLREIRRDQLITRTADRAPDRVLIPPHTLRILTALPDFSALDEGFSVKLKKKAPFSPGEGDEP